MADQPDFAAVAAVAGRQPYETWILPADHHAARRVGVEAAAGKGENGARQKTWQQTKSERTRKAILDAAVDCFYELGYFNTTTEHIARKAAGLARRWANAPKSSSPPGATNTSKGKPVEPGGWPGSGVQVLPSSSE